MGRRRKYTKKALGAAVKRYFDSISRTVDATEDVPTGVTDEYGHMIYKPEPVHNDLGEPMRYTSYIIPPTVGGLCRHLGISRQTWYEYSDRELHPDLREITERAKVLFEAYLEEQLLARKSNVEGVKFQLVANYGWKNRTEVELGDKTRSAVRETAAGLSLSERLAVVAAAAAGYREIESRGEGADADADASAGADNERGDETGGAT